VTSRSAYTQRIMFGRTDRCANPRRAMADVWVLLLILVFFALCVAFVRGCDRIIGPDDAQDLEPPSPGEDVVRESVGVGR
jgi:hypothetical protein